MSEETFDYICTPCERENKTFEAVKYCVECKDYCCQSCVDSHKKYSALIGHSFLDVGQGKQPGKQSTSLPEFPTERCSIHNGKIVDMYCETHGTVGCYACIAKDHKSCPESHIHSVSDMLESLFKLSDTQLTKSRLRQIIASMGTLGDSTDTRLEALNKARKETLDQIEIFQRVLESMLRKATESSQNEVEKVYQKLKNEILQNKRTIDDTSDALRDTSNKLNKSAANRAQQFVCSKIAEKDIKEAEQAMMKLQMTDENTDVEMSFHPDHKLKDYVQGLHGIGEVQGTRKNRTDLYKQKGKREIRIKVSSDSKTCSSWGCCLTDDHHLLFTDWNNKKVKRIDTRTLTFVDDCVLEGLPGGICCISKQEVAVGCRDPNMIQFVSIGNKVIPTRKIDTTHKCYDIGMKKDNLYVTDYESSMYVYDMSGTKLRTITHDAVGNELFTYSGHIAINESGNKMFVGNFKAGFVCFDGTGNHMSTIEDSNLDASEGVCGDGRGNIFVAGRHSHNVVQFNVNGKKVGVVVKQENGIERPKSICFHPNTNRMFVTMLDSDILKMYEFE
ncbi:hypothetical protein ACF0H5_017907 [Mactra antiquata]